MQRIQQFWQAQVAAEYGSAAVTAEFALWLLQLGAPPDLIRQALVIAHDEVDHATICFAVVTAAGDAGTVVADGVALQFPQTYSDRRKNLLAAVLGFYCLGETAAVPLFAAMRHHTRQTEALEAYGRILADEPRHAGFGWLVLAWMDDTWVETRAWLQELFPLALHRIAHHYDHHQAFDPPLSATELHWGLLPRHEYGTVFRNTILGLYAKHLKYYGVDVWQVWAQLPQTDVCPPSTG